MAWLMTLNVIMNRIISLQGLQTGRQRRKCRTNKDITLRIHWCPFRHWVLQGHIFIAGKIWHKTLPRTTKTCSVYATQTLQERIVKFTTSVNNSTSRDKWNGRMVQTLCACDQTQWNSVALSWTCKTQPGTHQTSAQRFHCQWYTQQTHIHMTPYINWCQQ